MIQQPTRIIISSYFIFALTATAFLACEVPANPDVTQDQYQSTDLKIEAEHVIIGHLGPQHLANLVYRDGKDGPKLVGWGRTPMTEWPVGSASKKQVVPGNPDHRYSNGGCALDLDGDGEEEIVVARGAMSNLNNASLMWFDPTEDGFWDEYAIANLWEGGFTAPHDIKPYVFENAAGNEVKTILANKSRRELYMFVVPNDPRGEWESRLIGEFPRANQSGLEIVDINQDGKDDIVSGIYWLEAPADPVEGKWKFHQYGTWDEEERRWGGMNQHGIADFDGDGQLEIVASEAEIPDARLSLFNTDLSQLERQWQEVPLDSGLDAPHSLVVLDLNNDEKPDFLVGEMTSGGWDFPLNPNPKIFAYINQGGFQFEKQLFSEGWGVHEMKVAPVKVDGKTMIYAADEIQPQKFNAMNTHVSYWLIDARNRSLQ